MLEPLQLRADAIQDRLTAVRDFQLRADTVNEEERSVEAVIATDAPVQVYDWRRGEVVDEVLLSEGARLPSQMPLLASHNRWSLDGVLGSIRSIHAENGSIVGRLFFTRDDADAEKAWNKVRQGHLVDVSAGYRVEEAVTVAPQQTAVVRGRSFTAKSRTLRVATNWTPKEGSLVPIGADEAAKIRRDISLSQTKEGPQMDPKLRAFLETMGLRKDSSEDEAKAFYDGLKPEDKARADAAVNPIEPTTNHPAPPEPTRNTPEPPPLPTPEPNATDAARQAIVDERLRVRELRELAGQDVPAEVLNRAIDEGWTADRASREFLTSVRESRGSGTGPAIHVHGRDSDVNRRSLAAALLIQLGQNPTECREYDTNNETFGTRFTEQDADLGDRLRGLSAPDLVRECVQQDTGRYYRTIGEAFGRLREDRLMGRAAVSGGTLAYVFGTNVYAKVVEGWSEVGDSTAGWCDEEDVPNFLTQEEITINYDGEPEQHARGGTATDATISDAHETYRAYRFSRKATVDEMDIINDRLGAVMKFPVLMGRAFRRMRPNMVYAALLNNAALVADSIAVFHASHSNLGSAVLAAEGLTTALTAMATQRQNSNRTMLDIQARYLIVPTALQWTAAALLTSVALAKTHADAPDAVYMPVNPVGPSVLKQVIGDNLTLVTDDRIGATGVWDPLTKAMVTGSATNWFLSSGPEHGVRVLYRRGTNRQPSVRSYVLDQGQWGLGWDMCVDMGAKIMDYRGLYKSTGA